MGTEKNQANRRVKRVRVVFDLMHATKVGNPNMLISIPLHSAARWEAWEVFITDYNVT